MEDVLGSYALVSTMLMSLAIAVWFSCSIATGLARARQQHKKHRYKALLAENQRLKKVLANNAKEHHLYKVLLTENQRLRSMLADTAKEHRLRKFHRTELLRRKQNRTSRNVS
jgi:CBS-domain-containing membrane protein